MVGLGQAAISYVAAGGERALPRPGDDDAADLVVRAHLRHGVVQLRAELPAHCIELRGPIHGDDRDALGLLDEDIVRHGGPPIRCADSQRSNT